MITTENRLVLEQAESTNETLKALRLEREDLPQLYTVVAREQIAGRGQRGNSWHSEAGEDLTFSFLLRSGTLQASEHYAVSEMAALGLYKTLLRYLTPLQAESLSIKWPNDIYYGESKIAGILIEHSLLGSKVEYSIVGIGLNLNGKTFPDGLPNPISLSLITGQTYDPEEVLDRLMRRFGYMVEEFILGDFSEVHREYMRALFRRDDFYSYRDSEGVFRAMIKDVLPNGRILMLKENGDECSYDFKEVTFVYDQPAELS